MPRYRDTPVVATRSVIGPDGPKRLGPPQQPGESARRGARPIPTVSLSKPSGRVLRGPWCAPIRLDTLVQTLAISLAYRRTGNGAIDLDLINA